MKELLSGSCYAYCLAYISLETDNITALTEAVLHGWDLGYIDADGYVSKPVKYLSIMGRAIRDIEKVTIEYLNDLPDEGLYAVEYELNGGGHFVVAKKGSVVFDPSGDSNAVKYGRLISYRKFVY